MDQRNKLSRMDFVPLSSARLVGRQGELELIWQHNRAVSAGSSRVVLLTGEIGIGKTCLLHEVGSRALESGTIVLRGSSTEAEGMPPYLPFLEALGEHIRAIPLDQLREQIAHAPHILASILPELVLRCDKLPEPHPAPAEQARLRLYKAIVTFLEAISLPHGLILMLDDLHWADSASLDLLCYIAQHNAHARLLILCTCRADEIEDNPTLGRAVNELVRQRVLTRIAVEPLSYDEVEALASGYLRGPISSAVSKRLYAKSEGNPFFAEELLRGWIEDGTLFQEKNQWLLVNSPPPALPASIVGVLRQRFSRLPRNTIDHLRVAANIGLTFDVPLLAAVEDVDVETVEEELREASHACLVRIDQQGTFTFSHDIIRGCLDAEVSASRRRRLHEAIGCILEARYERNSPMNSHQLAELAFHFTRSGDRSRSASYSLLAAEQALRAFAFDEARNHFRTTLDLLDAADDRRGDVLLKFGETSLLLGLHDEAVQAYEAALSWFLGAGSLAAATHAAHGLGKAHWRQNDLPAARAALERGLALGGDLLSAEAVLVLVDLSMLLTMFMNQYDQGSSYAASALEMARGLGNRRLEAAAIRSSVAGKICMRASDISSAPPILARAIALAEESDDPAEAAECCLHLAGIQYMLAEIKRSYSVSLRRRMFIEYSLQTNQLRNTYAWPVLLFSCQGAWIEADQAIKQTSSKVDGVASSTDRSFLHHVRGFLAYQREDYVSAEREFQLAMVNQERSLAGLLFHPAGLLGLTRAALGKHAQASVSMTELEACIAELPGDSLAGVSLKTCLALLAVALRDSERAARLYPELLAASGQHHWFLVDRVLGELACLCGEWERATLHLAAAEATARREDLRPELARTLLAQAKRELACRDQGSTVRASLLFKQALHLFEQLNLGEAAARVRHQLHPSALANLPALPAGLTRSEAKVLHLVTEGKNNRQIGRELDISEKTVANHLSHIFMKTDSENRAAATAFAIRQGLA